MLTFFIVCRPMPSSLPVFTYHVCVLPPLMPSENLTRACAGTGAPAREAIPIQPTAPHLFCMNDTDAARNALRGTTLPEKLASIGIESGRMLDIRNLDAIGRDYGIGIYLFFEKKLATTRTLVEVQEEYLNVPEFERPYVRVDRFLEFTKKNDPSFARTIEEFPLMIEIVAVGEMHDSKTDSTAPYVTGLMPFLDEFDVDIDPVERSQGRPL
jgi:hypothetical protein